MKKNSLCFIDDDFVGSWGGDLKIPVDSIITESMLKYFLPKYHLNDGILQILIEKILENDEINSYAYSNPEFFLDDDSHNPDCVVYDWDYGIGANASETFLSEICKKKYCLIFIFSGCDNLRDIQRLVDTDFKEYNNRITVFPKDENAVNTISSKLEFNRKNNFSFKFGNELKKYSTQAVENILIELAKYDLDVIIKSLTDNGNDEENLIDFICEKYKSLLHDNNFTIGSQEEGSEASSLEESINDSSLDSLWEYRLYSKVNLETIRKGDILKVNNEFWFIVTPNCELHQFWKKTYGILNYYRLYEIEENKQEIKNIYLSVSPERKLITQKKRITSLSNAIDDKKSDPFCLPYVGNKTFLLFPKQIQSTYIEKPSDMESGASLKVSMINNAEKIVTMNNPFLTELIEQCISNLKGFGVPDYDKDIQNNLAIKLKGILD